MDAKIYAAAIRVLAGREHSGYELKTKLEKKGYAASDIDDVVEQLIKDKYLDETRFAEVFVSSKIRRGLGPIRIQLELQQRRVDESLIDEYLDFNQTQWFELASDVRCKRFGNDLPIDIKDQSKQIRFLQQRGFTQQHIMSIIKNNNFED